MTGTAQRLDQDSLDGKLSSASQPAAGERPQRGLRLREQSEAERALRVAGDTQITLPIIIESARTQRAGKADVSAGVAAPAEAEAPAEASERPAAER